MKIADTHSLFIALIWMILFSSCSDENNTPDINGKEIWIGLQIGPSLEYDSQPLSRATVQEAGIYAVNVFWKKGSTFQPYATGLFEYISDISIGLIEGYIYRFDCTFLKKNELPYNNNGYFGLPFSITTDKRVDAAVTNKLVISINPLNENQNFHQHIYKGAMHLEANDISERPTDTHRFYGSATLDLINADPVTEGNRPVKFVSIELKRAYYTLRFAAENLSIGDSIKVETSNAKAFLIECTDATTSLSMSEERLFSLQNVANIGNGNINATENLPINVYYRPKNAEEWTSIISNQPITIQRNKKNLIKIINIDKHYDENTSISFEGDNTDLDPTEEEHQNIG